MVKNEFSLRIKTHVGQLLIIDFFLKVLFFINEVWDKRASYEFFDSAIANMEETPLDFSIIPNKMVAKKGTKSIIIITFEQEKCLISAFIDYYR